MSQKTFHNILRGTSNNNWEPPMMRKIWQNFGAKKVENPSIVIHKKVIHKSENGQYKTWNNRKNV